MKTEKKSGVFKVLLYMCVSCVIALGLMSIVGTGGGGGGGGGNPAPTSGDGTSDGDGASVPAFAGFDFSLNEGDFWEYQWDWYKNSWAQGSGGSTTETNGTFRVTLGSPKEIDGVTAYEVHVSGRTGTSETDFAPRWNYVALANNQILGSEDGTTLSTIFDAQEGTWPGGGFFQTSPSFLYTAQDGNIDNDYISSSCIEVGRSDSEDQCQYFPGVGNICGDSSYNFQEYEYYIAEIGPVGYFYYNSFSDCGGGFCSGATWERNVGLVACSLRGDSVDYELETEPNDSPEAAQAMDLSFDYVGSASEYDDGSLKRFNTVQEVEPNEGGWSGQQTLTVPALVIGDTAVGDLNSSFQFWYNSQWYPTNAEDWFEFTLTSPASINIRLNFQDSTTADLDLFLYNSACWNPFPWNCTALDYSVDDNPQSGNMYETIQYALGSGTFTIIVDAFATPAGRTDYTLDLYAGEKGNEQQVEDWYSFTLTAQTTLTITLDFQEGDADLYLFDENATTVLGSSNNQSVGTPESIATSLGPGTYVIGVDAYSGSMDYTLTVQ